MDSPHIHAENTLFSAIAWGLVAIAAGIYLYGVYVTQHNDRPWHRWRTISFLVAALLLASAFIPAMVDWAHRDIRGHMVQHLLLGMVAPLGLVLSAPITLALRTLPTSLARRLIKALRLRAIRWLTHPVSALLLNVGGMYVLYATPLYARALDSMPLHALIHLHFVLAGYLFCWAILAGPDYAPSPHSMRFRLAVLFLSMAAHAILGKLMYAFYWPAGTPYTIAHIQTAAQLMYYGGDLAELLLAIALFATWYRTPEAPRSRFFCTPNSKKPRKTGA